MRLLALADEEPPADPVELVARNHADGVLTLGDLRPEWIASLDRLDLPRLGVHGNHDAEHALVGAGVEDLHLARAEIGAWSFTGFEGCVRYRDGPHQYTQRQASRLVRRLPAADVLLCHCPPAGVNDEPDDRAHVASRPCASGWNAISRASCCTGTPRRIRARGSTALGRPR